jgi:hypothetical protein
MAQRILNILHPPDANGQNCPINNALLQKMAKPANRHGMDYHQPP